jgi:hypothetical protein
MTSSKKPAAPSASDTGASNAERVEYAICLFRKGQEEMHGFRERLVKLENQVDRLRTYSIRPETWLQIATDVRNLQRELQRVRPASGFPIDLSGDRKNPRIP